MSRYRELFFDGCNGWLMGRVVSQEEAFRESNGSRNCDGLLESECVDVLWVPLDDKFELNPQCANDPGDDDDFSSIVKKLRKRIHGWAYGRDPEEFGWVCDGKLVTAYDLYDAYSRDDAIRIGISEDAVDLFEGGMPDRENYSILLGDFMQAYFN